MLQQYKGYTITKLHTHTKFSIFPPFIRSLPTKPTCRKSLIWQSFKLRRESLRIDACYKKIQRHSCRIALKNLASVLWPRKINAKASLKLSEQKGLAYLKNTWWKGGFLKGWLAIFRWTFSPTLQEYASSIICMFIRDTLVEFSLPRQMHLPFHHLAFHRADRLPAVQPDDNNPTSLSLTSGYRNFSFHESAF